MKTDLRTIMTEAIVGKMIRFKGQIRTVTDIDIDFLDGHQVYLKFEGSERSHYLGGIDTDIEIVDSMYSIPLACLEERVG